MPIYFLNICLKCFISSYDADCTCATVGAIIGGILGYSGISKELKVIDDYFVIGIDVKRGNNSIKTLAEETVAIGLKLGDIKVDSTRIQYLGVPAIG